MRWYWAMVTSAALASGLAGCEGCLGLDDYELVPPGFSQGGYTTTTTTTGSGNFGAGGEGPDPCQEGPATVFALAPADADDDALSCPGVIADRPGLRIVALDASSGVCSGLGTIELAEGAELVGVARVAGVGDQVAYAAGMFLGGDLEMPARCQDGTAVPLSLPVGAAEAIFVTRLEVGDGGLCTDWARAVGSASAGSLRLGAVASDAQGAVAIGGSLGGGSATFYDGTSSREVTGSAFFARYRSDGTLGDIVPFEGGAHDAVEGLDSIGATWLATGTLQLEQPACHGCAGSNNVVDAAEGCVATGGGGAGGDDTGGAGGAGASGGSDGGGGGAVGGAGGIGAGGASSGGSSSGGTGGTGGSAVGDANNAFLWRWSTTSSTCSGLDSFGTDGLGDGDAQAGFAVDALLSQDGCVAHWTGLAGLGTWPLDALDPTTNLFDSGGTLPDAFIARFDGADSLECALDARPTWSVRMTPTVAGAAAWGSLVRTRACQGGAFVGVHVTAAPLASVELHRCVRSGGCSELAPSMDLVDAPSQLVVAALGAGGTVDWYAAIGPVDASVSTLGGAVMGSPTGDLIRARNDLLAVTFRTMGPLVSSGLLTSDCPELDSALEPASYMIGLAPDGDSGFGRCSWAVRLGP